MHSPVFDRSIILTGPTASGKSALALQLADHFPIEIISADSMTLYRGMDIGTAKPTPAERARVRHHLIDVRDPWEPANVAWWLEQAAQAVQDIEARGKRAVFVGGTPFYLKALLCGLFDSPPTDPELRRTLEAEAEAVGQVRFHERLKEVDAASAARLHPNDVRRVVRAIEVYQLSGKPLSEWQQQNWWTGEEPRFSGNQCLVIDWDREKLMARINDRVQMMFDAGWIDEVRRLRSLPYPVSKEPGLALGYPEIGQYLDGQRNLSDTIAEIQLRTRQFAKRQLTWFRGMPGAQFRSQELRIEDWIQLLSETFV